MVYEKRERVADDFNIENPNYSLGQKKRRKEAQNTGSSSSKSKLPNENINNLQVDKRSIAQQARKAREKVQKSLDENASNSRTPDNNQVLSTRLKKRSRVEGEEINENVGSSSSEKPTGNSNNIKVDKRSTRKQSRRGKEKGQRRVSVTINTSQVEETIHSMAMTPQEHIDYIRKTKFSIGGEPNPLMEDLHQAVKNLSAELYAKDAHFLMEIIQNAKDNVYEEGVKPSLEFIGTSRDLTGTGASSTLLVFNNEKGFSAKNIESISSVGRSTKKGQRQEGYIGEKVN